MLNILGEAKRTGLVQPGENRTALIATYNDLMGRHKDRTTVFTEVHLGQEATDTSRNMRNFNGVIRKQFLVMKVVEQWEVLPGEVVESPSLETFQTQLDTALNNLLWLTIL